MKRRIICMALVFSLGLTLIPVNNTYADENNESDYMYIRAFDDNVESVSREAESANESDNDVELSGDGEVQTSYGTDFSNYTSVYPDTRQQGSYQICWAFSSVAMAEFDRIIEKKVDRNVDYSELALAYFTYHSSKDPLGGTSGDTRNYRSTNGKTYLSVGGNLIFTARTLMSWCGLTNETTVPYSWCASSLTGGIDEKYEYTGCQTKLKNAYIISIKDDSEYVKKEIANRGAVAISYYSARSNLYKTVTDPYDSSQTACTYYDNNSDTANHSVVIVGWDDNFSKNNFAVTPDRDGAWLVRNSWDTTVSRSKNSYFWLSYCDKSISPTAWSFDFTDADEYDNNYQYDGGLYSAGTDNRTVANVFDTSANENARSEKLKAVSFSISNETNVDYEINVYTNLTSDLDPTSGMLQTSATTTGTTTYEGLYTVDLTNPVLLGSDSKFSVVVKLSKTDAKAGDKFGVDREYGFSQAGILSPVAVGDNQSYIFKNAVWSEIEETSNSYGYGNNCIKAFTTNEELVPFSITYVLNGGVNSLFNPTTYTNASGEINLEDAKRDDYNFTGWYSDIACKEQCTKILKGSSGDITLYAGWEKVSNLTDQLAEKVKNVESIIDSDDDNKTDSLISKTKTAKVSDEETSNQEVFFVNPTSIKSLKLIKNNQIKVLYTRVDSVTGYYIEYSTDKKFRKLNTVMVKAKKSSVTLKKLKKNKTYYVRIRSYISKGNTIHLSSTSKVKKIKTKK